MQFATYLQAPQWCIIFLWSFAIVFNAAEVSSSKLSLGQVESGEEPNEIETLSQPYENGHPQNRNSSVVPQALSHSSQTDETTQLPNTITQPVFENSETTQDPQGGITIGDLDIHLADLVKNLQLQLKESQTSQARTRSVLSLIQEKQVAQDDVLSHLKNEISTLRRDQQRDHTVLENLRRAVSDDRWAVADLKISQNQIKLDLGHMKQFQEESNETVLRMEDYMAAGDQLTLHTQGNIKDLQMDVSNLHSMMAYDRKTLYRLKRVIHNLNDTFGTHSNKIPPLPNFDPSSIPDLASGDAPKVDTVASTLEEKDNFIGHNLVAFLKKEKKMHQRVEHFHRRFIELNAEISKIYAMFYNLSLQISTLENRLLIHQKQQYEHDLTELQKSFLNFTHQIFNMEQFHMSSKLHFNATVQNRNEISDMNSMVENHQMRIKTLEDLLLEYRSAGSHSTRTTQTHLAALNNTVQEIQSRIMDHSSHATDVFVDVNDKLTEFTSQMKHNDNRLTRMELKVVNESLNRCQKANTDIKQDNKLSDLSRNIEGLDAKTQDQKSQTERLDRGLSRLYQEVEKQVRTLGEVMTHAQSLMHLVPEVNILQDEVNNFVQHLPRDCTESINSNVQEKSGSYLIKPDQSSRSSSVYCEVPDEGEEPWTIIQRRLDGTESFARTWDEYKQGFGNPETEYWIGNDNLHYLTSQEKYILHIDLWDLNNVYWYAEYHLFALDSEEANYRLHIDDYHGNATDAMRYSNMMHFSTLDRDNDASSTHCAKFYTSGWWYKHCHYSNLNGRYTVGVVWFNHNFDEWIQLKKSVMKIRPVSATINKTKPDITTESYTEPPISTADSAPEVTETYSGGASSEKDN